MGRRWWPARLCLFAAIGIAGEPAGTAPRRIPNPITECVLSGGYVTNVSAQTLGYEYHPAAIKLEWLIRGDQANSTMSNRGSVSNANNALFSLLQRSNQLSSRPGSAWRSHASSILGRAAPESLLEMKPEADLIASPWLARCADQPVRAPQ